MHDHIHDLVNGLWLISMFEEVSFAELLLCFKEQFPEELQ